MLVIDTCMDPSAGPLFARAAPDTDVVITWQPFTWKRPVDEFTTGFLQASERAGARAARSVVRYTPPGPHPHNAMVELSLAWWLPIWLPPG